MTAWFRFLFSNKRLLNFGFLLNFFSAYGQTFFISIFVPFWVLDFGISNAYFGSMYASVTIASAFLLSVAGKYIDRMSLRKYSLLVFIGLALSVLFLSVANTVWLLGAALLLVRWLGQGMLTHTSSTGIAKYFDDNRGKALGFTALGHPAGQFFIPLAMAPLLLQLGWRYTLVIFVLLSAIVMIPSAMAIKPVAIFRPQKKSALLDNAPKQKSHLLSFKFWLIASNIFFVPFFCTAVFLYQYSIAEGKGWDRDWVTFSFAFFAIANAITLLLSGNLVDKYGGVRLFPLYLVPTLVALLLIAFIDAKWVFPVFYALLGTSTGLGSTIKTAMQVEVYGKNDLGKVRSYFSTVLVFSTALGPPAFGFFIDRNYSFDSIMGIAALMVAVIFVASFKVKK